MSNPLGFGQPTQIMQARWAGTTVTTATSGSITVPAGASVLRKVLVDFTENASRGTAGVTTLTLACNGQTVYVGAVFLPSAPGSAVGDPWHRNIPLDDPAFSAPAGTTFTWTLSSALTAGSMTINLYFS